MLSRRDIEKELGRGINIYPLHVENIKENSINLTISRNAWALGSGSVVKTDQKSFVIVRNNSNVGKHYIERGQSAIVRDGKRLYLVLLPHVTTIVETSEVIGVENYIGGTLHSKVGMVAQGVGAIGTMLGPNFCGHLMISLHNITDDAITIPVGDTFISVVFDRLDTPATASQNPNISGHVDKLAELGVKIDKGTREYLTEDWKCSVSGIRTKMCESNEYIEYKQQIMKNRRFKLIEYISFRNVLLALMCICAVIGLAKLASWADLKSSTHVWSDRYWTVVLSGIIVPIVMAARKLFKRR